MAKLPVRFTKICQTLRKLVRERYALKWRKKILAAHQSGQVEAALVRGSDFYGPGVLGSALGEFVFPAVLKGKPARVTGNIDARHSYTYINDFGRALALVGTHAETLTTRQIVTKAYNQVNHNPQFPPMGKSMARIIDLFILEVREMVEMMYEFEEDFVVDDSKFIQKFGNIAAPIDIALAETLDWYRNYTQS